MSDLIPHVFNNISVRTIDRDGEIWFVASDVCNALEIKNPRDALTRLDEDEKTTVGNTDGRAGQGAQSYNLINESGLYSLILRSRKPEAKRFKKWVTAEVLPSIRKTGNYSPPELPAPQPAPLSSGNLEKFESVLFNKRELANLINHVDWCFYWFQYISSPLESLNKNLVSRINEHFIQSHIAITLISEDCHIPLLSKQKMRHFPWCSNDLEQTYEYLKSRK